VCGEGEIEREGEFLPLWFSAHRSGALFLASALSYKEGLYRAQVIYVLQIVNVFVVPSAQHFLCLILLSVT
jgi:hypothetical protein